MVSSLIWLLLSCADTCTNPLDMEAEESNLAQPDKLLTFGEVTTERTKKVSDCKILAHRGTGWVGGCLGGAVA